LLVQVGSVGAPTLQRAGPALELVDRWTTELLHLTIADVHATSRIPVSTRWLCKHKPQLLGAQKHEGVWYINRAKFERYMATSDREVPIARATEEPRKGNGMEAA